MNRPRVCTEDNTGGSQDEITLRRTYRYQWSAVDEVVGYTNLYCILYGEQAWVIIPNH